ncbi:MAG: periplasmic heavy metal sensor [Pseudomonadota bacterium]
MALVVSVGLNLVILGLIAGAAMDHRRAETRPEPAAMARELGLGPYARALSPDRQLELGGKVAARARQNAGDRPPLRRELRAGLRNMLQELRSDDFDADRVAALLARQNGAIEVRRRSGQESLVEILSDMSPDERLAYADRLEQMLRRPLRPR